MGKKKGGEFFKRIEAAGEAHLNLVSLRIQGVYCGYNEAVVEEEEIVEEEENEDLNDAKAKEFSGKRRKKAKPLDKQDYYELLGLGNLRWSATEKDIKNACTNFILFLNFFFFNGEKTWNFWIFFGK